jgi:hypothetical protein
MMNLRIVKPFLVAVFVVAVSLTTFAQKYGNALGVRLADGNVYRSAGITFQQRIFSEVTLEGILQTDFTHNTVGHLIIERHVPIISKRVNYYVGGGMSMGNEESTIKNKLTGEKTPTSYGNSTLGADLVAGVEITMLKFNLSIDYKPNFNITGRESWYQGEVGISARAVIMDGTAYDKRMKAKQKAKKKKARMEKRQEFIDKLKGATQEKGSTTK